MEHIYREPWSLSSIRDLGRLKGCASASFLVSSFGCRLRALNGQKAGRLKGAICIERALVQ